MLKIKDNIDLKELEKYGLKKQQVGFYNAYAKYMLKGLYKESIIVWISDRIIQIDAIKLNDIVYDLIKADLVEKVSDDNE